MQIPGPPPKGSLIEGHNPLGMWAMKLPSADTVVVKRTVSTFIEHPEGLPGAEETPGYAKHRKNFWFCVKPAHFGVNIASRSLMIPMCFLIIGLLIGLLAKFPLGRYLLLKYPESFSAGLFSRAGPTDEEVKSAPPRSKCGLSGMATVMRPMHRSVSGPDVGYITTSIILVQCTLILLSQRGNLPKGGVYTPGAVFGPTDLQWRLQENGLSFDVHMTRSMR
ncbi:hypothetical protein SETIT_2G377400v2 [Setaria italica]|uniref:Uncharacterized protein n=1 Tax=Setaria italica TaxID=4555 RepID=K4A1P7_SETIT|nr:hypothetical protein SETIT_2G377400v2 [Setaria italica]